MQARDTVALQLTETHKTVKNIKARGAFTISIADAAHVIEADYFGVESGNRVSNKFEKSGLTANKSEIVDAPVINEFPLCLECEFIEYQSNAYGCGVIGKVVNVTADESVMIDGKLDMSLVNAIAFDPYTHGCNKATERVEKFLNDGLTPKKDAMFHCNRKTSVVLTPVLHEHITAACISTACRHSLYIKYPF